VIVSDIVIRVRRVFGDEAAVQIVNDDIIRWINDAQIEIVKNNEDALPQTTLLNLVANQATYALPADLLILRSLRYKLPGMLSFSNLRYKNMQEFDDSVDGWDGTVYGPSSPQFFTKYAGDVILFPTPDTAMTGGLKVLYNQKPTDIALLSDTLALPALYNNTIFKYCMWQASLLDEDHEPALMYQNNFQTDLETLANSEASDPVATYPTITTLIDDM
jgi:hypothetical protein